MMGENIIDVLRTWLEGSCEVVLKVDEACDDDEIELSFSIPALVENPIHVLFPRRLSSISDLVKQPKMVIRPALCVRLGEWRYEKAREAKLHGRSCKYVTSQIQTTVNGERMS
jgi:hypothetical protein